VDGPRLGPRRSATLQRSILTSSTDTSDRSTAICLGDTMQTVRPWFRTVRASSIIPFAQLVTFDLFGSAPTGRSTPEAGQSALGLGRCLLFHRTIRSVDMSFCIGSVQGSSWCRGRSALSLFFQKASPVRKNLRYSDSRFRVVVDEPLAPVEHII
jgi:hypothetical protein